MPDGYLVSVGVKADFSDLKSASKEGATAIEDFQARAAKVVAAFMAAANEGSAATDFLNKKMKELAAAGIAVVPAMEQATAALRASQAAAEGDASAVNSAAAAKRALARDSGLASTEMRVFEGSTLGAARAAGQFAVTSLGLGPIMAAAFPVIGALALGDMIVSLIGRLVTFGGDAEKIAQELGVGWLDGAVLQLEGFGKKLAEIDKQIAESQQKTDKYIAEQKENSFAQIGENEGPAAENTARSQSLTLQREGLEAMLPDLREKLALENKINDAIVNASTHTTFGKPVSDADNSKAKSLGIDLTPGTMGKQIEQTTAQLQEENEQIDALQSNIDKLAQKAGTEETPKTTGSAASSGRSYTDIAAQKREEGASLGELVLYWEQVVSTTGKYHEELLRAEEEFQKGISASGKIKGSSIGPEPAALDASQMLQHKETEAEADESINKAMEEQEKHAARIYESTIKIADFKEKMGQMSPAQAAQAKTTASQTEQNTVVGGLQAQQHAIAPMGPTGLSDADLAEYDKLQAQITAAEEQGSQQRELIAQQEALRNQQVYTQMFDGMYAPLQTFTDHWLTSGQRMGAAFQRMGDQMAMSVINALMKIAAQELIGLALHQTVGSQQRLDDAKTAASGAYAATAGIPGIGPFLAPAMAAAAFAAAAAYESGADYIPRTGMAMLHQGEAVATAGENSRISQVLNMASGQANGGQGGGVHFHDHSNFTGIDGASVAGMARTHGAEFRRQTMRQMRLMNKI